MFDMKKSIILTSLVALLQFAWGNDSQICTDSCSLTFDDSAIECMYLHPKEILSNIDTFWTNNKAYNLVYRWHTNNKVPIPYKEWTQTITKLANISPNKVIKQIAFVNAKAIREQESLFRAKAIPHIYSFLPESTIPLNANIYLLTGTVPYAFNIGENIVMDVASPNFNRDPERILNILIHEVFHIGYRNVATNRKTPSSGSKMERYMTEYLFMEGLANYVSYTGQNIFPNHAFEDYILLENQTSVLKQIKIVNDLFSKIGVLSDEELRNQSWKIGILKRGYYVVGAYMAQTIDTKLGRKALTQTISEGASEFFKLYNSQVSENQKVYFSSKIKKIS